ncbi:hypothetical protein PH7735_00429 [Shimia thalassica]|jgi:hypothetical protein|uniref:Uncharacterized protein n=1 Tax=Shimia thalassica TaxID=1715693 RepID=A0A0P1IAX9_9RHOB|nr:hypothetical protein PH7735_00429 [Shimia thalassica]
MLIWTVIFMLGIFSAALIGKVLMKRYPDSGFDVFSKK